MGPSALPSTPTFEYLYNEYRGAKSAALTNFNRDVWALPDYKSRGSYLYFADSDSWVIMYCEAEYAYAKYLMALGDQYKHYTRIDSMTVDAGENKHFKLVHENRLTQFLIGSVNREDSTGVMVTYPNACKIQPGVSMEAKARDIFLQRGDECFFYRQSTLFNYFKLRTL